MCKFCEGNEFIEDDSYWSIYLRSGYSKIYINIRGTNHFSYFNINFCPMCGNKILRFKNESASYEIRKRSDL